MDKPSQRTKVTAVPKGNALWSYPTPYDVALAQVDQFLATHQLTWDERIAIRRYYGDKRTWAIRHLKLTEAARRIAATINDPPISIPKKLLDSPTAGQAQQDSL